MGGREGGRGASEGTVGGVSEGTVGGGGGEGRSERSGMMRVFSIHAGGRVRSQCMHMVALLWWVVRFHTYNSVLEGSLLLLLRGATAEPCEDAPCSGVQDERILRGDSEMISLISRAVMSLLHHIRDPDQNQDQNQDKDPDQNQDQDQNHPDQNQDQDQNQDKDPDQNPDQNKDQDPDQEGDISYLGVQHLLLEWVAACIKDFEAATGVRHSTRMRERESKR